MKIFQVSGVHRVTGRHEVAQVQGETAENAMKLFGITHRRITVLDKRGIKK